MARFGGPGEEARVLGEEARRRLSGHHPARDTQIIALSAINPPGPLEQSRGTQVCVSAKVGGREQSDRWKGESEAFSLQEVDAGNERANESHPRASPGRSRDRTLFQINAITEIERA